MAAIGLVAAVVIPAGLSGPRATTMLLGAAALVVCGAAAFAATWFMPAVARNRGWLVGVLGAGVVVALLGTLFDAVQNAHLLGAPCH